MGQITIEIPQNVNLIYQVKSESFLPQLEHLVEENQKNANENDSGKIFENEETLRTRRMNWLKTNSEQYAGIYVALDGDKLVGAGKTIREADEQAKQKGVSKPFLVRVSSKNELLSGGW